MPGARVVITGHGAISALGMSATATRASMREGVCGIGPLEFQDVERLSITIGGQIRDYRPEDHFGRQELTLYDPFTQFALLAAREAMAESGLVIDEALSERAGVVLGTAGGGLQTQDENYRSVYEEGKNRVHPFVVPRLMNNAAASHVSMAHHLQGPTYTVATACSSSNHAMGQALNLIRAGQADVVLTGGSESMLCFGGIKAWEGLRVMSKDGCRPFCATRNGMVQGEGAAVFVFEEYGHARARGATMLAEVKGFAMTSDASDIVMPNVVGATRAMRGALRDAGLNASDIGYINAHGTSTQVNDRVESIAIKKVFGEHAFTTPVSSSKSMLGHLIAAAGVVEMIISVMAIRRGVLPPTLNYETQDPDCNLDYIPKEAREKRVDHILSNSFGFGGQNISLVASRFAE